MQHLLQDIRFGVRIMIRNPWFTAISVLALSLGIGAVTTMFSVINGAVLRGLPFEDPHELVFIQRYNENRDGWDTAIPILDFQDIRERQRSFEDISGWFDGTVNVSYEGNPQRFTGSRMTDGFLELLGTSPLIGRGISAEDNRPGSAPVLVLGYGIWQRHFNGSTDIIGQTVHVNGKLGTIVGVMPPGFAFPASAECWISLGSAVDWSEWERSDNTWSLNVMGRLKDGVNLEMAEAELTGMLNQLADEYPSTNDRYRIASVRPYAQQILGEETVQTMWVMVAMGAFVLLIACANVTNLLLARATLRSKELAIRTSLGASRGRILTQMLTESVLLASAGALGGLLVARWGTQTLMSYAEVMNMPFWMDFRLDTSVLLVVTGVTALSGILSGLVPSLRASKVHVNEILKDDSRTGSSLQMGIFSKGLVVAQVAISCILLIVTGLMMRSVQNIANTDLKFDTTAVYTARLGLFEGDYPEEADRRNFFRQLLDNLRARPEIDQASLYGRFRWGLIGVNWNRMGVEGEEERPSLEDYPLCNSETVEVGYFETLGIKLLAGRSFNEFDTEDNADVAIINQSLAKELFGHEDPIGQRIRRQIWPQELAQNPDPETIDRPWLTVIGIAPDMAMQGVGNTTDSAGRGYFRPLAQMPAPMFMTIAAKGRGDPMALNPVVRQEIQKLDPNLPIYAVGTPEMIMNEDNRPNQIIANIFKFFGAVAVFLASIGMYGVMSFAVNQRWIEFGIRSALGATGRNLLSLVFQGGLWQLGIGLVIGLAGAYGFSQLLRTLLYGVETHDPITYLLVALLAAGVAVVAIIVPARKAARVDPAQALRHE